MTASWSRPWWSRLPATAASLANLTALAPVIPNAIRWSVQDVLLGEDPVVRLDQAVDQGLGCVLLMQVKQGGRVDHIVLERAAQGHQEHQSALGCDGVEAGEAIVADLGGHPVDAQVPGAGIVNTDPAGGFQPGLLERGLLGMERVMALG